MLHIYKLDNSKQPIACSFTEYIEFINNKENQISKTRVNGYEISTVFIGLVAFFETIVQKGNETIWFYRSHSYKKAMESHDIAIEMVKNKRKVDLWTNNLL